MTTLAPTVIRHLRSLAAREHDLSDEELLLRYVRRRDQAAFAELVRRHGPMVLAVCRRVLRHDHDADDAFQATFLVLARSAASVRSGSSLASWLHGVALRLSLKARAARRPTAALPEGGEPAHDSATDPSWRDVAEVLDVELGRLPESLRAALVLCYLEGLTRDEAAARLGCPLGTLKARLERGRELLRQRLTRRGLALSAVLAVLALERSSVSAALADSLVSGQVPLRVLALAEAFGSRLPVARVVTGLLLLAGLVLSGTSAFAPPPPPRQQEPAKAVEEKSRLDAFGDPLPAGAVARLGTLRLYHGDNVHRVVLSPDAKLVVSTDGSGENKLWDADTGKELPLADADRKAFIFAAKGKLLVTGWQPADTVVRDLMTGKEVKLDGLELTAERTRADRSADKTRSRDGKLFASSDAKGVHVFDADSGQERPALLDMPKEHAMSVTFSDDGTLLAAPFVSTTDVPEVRVWDLATGKLVSRMLAKDAQVYHAAFSADGKTLAAADGNSVTLFDVKTGKRRHDHGHTYYVSSVAFTPDGKTLITSAGYTDDVVRLWDPLTGKERGRWTGHTLGVQAVVVSPDGKLAATGSQDGTLRLWDVAAGKEIGQFEKGKESVWALAFGPDGKTLFSAGGSIRVWDVTTRKQVRSFGNKVVMYLAASPDGKYLATVESGGVVVRLWDAEAGRELRQFAVGDERLVAPTFAPDGVTLAAGDSSGLIHLWDAATGRELRVIGEPMKPGRGSGYVLGGITFSPDGRTMAVGFTDLEKPVRLWEVVSGQQRGRFAGHGHGVTRLAFSPDGSLLASGAWDRTAIVWDVTGRHLSRPGKPASEEELIKLWNDLGDADAAKAYRALNSLRAGGTTAVVVMKTRLKPAATPDLKTIERLLKELDHDDFATREKASAALLALGDSAEPSLRKAAAGELSAEARRRVESLLAKLDPVTAPDLLRALRAVEALEGIATPEARGLLQELAKGDPDARVTREAKASLRRH